MNILTLNILVDNVEEFASENEKELNGNGICGDSAWILS